MFDLQSRIPTKLARGAEPQIIEKISRIELAQSVDGQRLYVSPTRRALHPRDLVELETWATRKRINVCQSLLLISPNEIDPASLTVLTQQCSKFSHHVLVAYFAQDKPHLVWSRNQDLRLLSVARGIKGLRTDSKAVESFARKSLGELQTPTLAEVLAGAEVHSARLQYLVREMMKESGVGPCLSRSVSHGGNGPGLSWNSEHKKFIVRCLPGTAGVNRDKQRTYEVDTHGTILQSRPASTEITLEDYQRVLRALQEFA